MEGYRDIKKYKGRNTYKLLLPISNKTKMIIGSLFCINFNIY